jgi:hypothetical protein
MGNPKMVGLQWKIHLQMDDMGYPYFQETTNVLWGSLWIINENL